MLSRLGNAVDDEMLNEALGMKILPSLIRTISKIENDTPMQNVASMYWCAHLQERH